MASVVLFLLFFACFASIVIETLRLGISPMPSSRKAKQAIVDLLPKNIEGTIYELGSGWGGLALLLAKRHASANIIALELSPIPYFVSRIRHLLSRTRNLSIIRKNIYGQDLSDAKAVVCYLFPEGMRKLAPKLREEIPSGCMLVSNSFALEGWKPESVLYLDDWAATRIYRYDAVTEVRNGRNRPGGP